MMNILSLGFVLLAVSFGRCYSGDLITDPTWGSLDKTQTTVAKVGAGVGLGVGVVAAGVGLGVAAHKGVDAIETSLAIPAWIKSAKSAVGKYKNYRATCVKTEKQIATLEQKLAALPQLTVATDANAMKVQKQLAKQRSVIQGNINSKQNGINQLGAKVAAFAKLLTPLQLYIVFNVLIRGQSPCVVDAIIMGQLPEDDAQANAVNTKTGNKFTYVEAYAEYCSVTKTPNTLVAKAAAVVSAPASSQAPGVSVSQPMATTTTVRTRVPMQAARPAPLGSGSQVRRTRR